jgi:aldehyde dehydrogenase (NAD+)
MLEGKHALRKYATLTDAASEIKFSSGFGMTMTCPLGVVVIISPWNYPVNVMCRKALPAIISGNTVVFKPATFTPWSGIFMAELFDKSGIPGGVFNCVTGKGGALGERLVSHPDVKAVSFTGSTEVGRKINTAAAKNFTRTQLELGGKNALIVDSDADLAKAAEAAIAAGYGCSGQWCTSTSRILLHRNVKEKFTDILLDKVRKIRVGNSIDPESDMGPVAGETQYNNTMKYIEVAKSEGAELLFGGDFRDDKKYSLGYFIPPTLFAEVTESMTIFREEIFGPVIGITEYSDFNEAIKLMNASCYGLSSSIFTNNLSRAMEYAKRAETGLVHVNIHTGYKEPCLPFGGWKESGNGNPENGDEGIEFFTEKKAIYINT